MPFGYSNHVFLTIDTAAAAGDSSGCSFEAPAAGAGAALTAYIPTEATTEVGIRLHANASPILDANLAVITPNVLSNPARALDVVIRSGQEAAGLILAAPDFILGIGKETVVFGGGSGIFIPPGFTLTVLETTVNTALVASYGLINFYAPPT